MKWFKVIVFVWSSTVVFGQYDGKDSLIASRYRPGFMWFNTGWRPAKEGKPRKYDRLMVDLNYTTWMDKSFLKTTPRGSIGWGIHTMWDIPLNEGNGVALGIGVNYRNQRVGLINPLILDATRKVVQYLPDSTFNSSVSRSLMSSHTVAIPLELRFRLRKWRHVKLHLGGTFGYRFGATTKSWTGGGRPNKEKDYPSAKGITYGVHARIGIRNWAFFADYNLAKQFDNALSTQINPLTFGVTLSVF